MKLCLFAFSALSSSKRLSYSSLSCLRVSYFCFMRSDQMPPTPRRMVVIVDDVDDAVDECAEMMMRGGSRVKIPFTVSVKNKTCLQTSTSTTYSREGQRINK